MALFAAGFIGVSLSLLEGHERGIPLELTRYPQLAGRSTRDVRASIPTARNGAGPRTSTTSL